MKDAKDTAPKDHKRAELHVHSNMSMMDATNSISDYVKQAKQLGAKKRSRSLIIVRYKLSQKRIVRG